MFVLVGKDLVDLVTRRIPEVVEKVMQRGHSKWCDSARIVPWSAGDEVGATLRVSIKPSSVRASRGDFALSWGVALNGQSKMEIALYDGDMAGLLHESLFGRDGQVDDVRLDLDSAIKGRVGCADVNVLVSRVVEKVRNAVVAHKMMEGA
jgi:hypothetical protein